MRIWLVSALTLMLSLNASCSSVELAPAAQAHAPRDGFQNNYVAFEPRGLASLLHWKWQAMLEGLPRPPAAAIPRVAPDLGFISSNGLAGQAMVPAMTWVGHATVLAQFGGLNVLTDPIFSERASPVSFVGPRRAVPSGLALSQLPRIDVVLISHNHYDHLDEASVVALAGQAGGPPLFLVPQGNKAWFAELGITSVVEMAWWQSYQVAAVEFVFTPVQHWSGRGFADRMKTLWGGWAAFAQDFSLYFAGDTGYSPDFADIGRRLASRPGREGFDLALVPVGAYEPRWFMATQHVSPDEAVRMHQDLKARKSLGIHWGTFELTDESLDEPPRALARARKAAGLSDDDFFLLAIGETRKLVRRQTGVPP